MIWCICVCMFVFCSREGRCLTRDQFLDILGYDSQFVADWAQLVLIWLLVHIRARRSEEHTSELQSLMRISYAVFCLKKKIIQPKALSYQTVLTKLSKPYIFITVNLCKSEQHSS